MGSEIGWELYRSFLGVLREGSLSGAARALGLTQPTVGRHVAALEAALRVPLFTRSSSGLMPTDVALALRAHAEAMESTADALARAATSFGEDVRGVVRISASDVVGVEVLPPIVARLRQRHPALTIELALTNRVQDLLRREADIAVRMTRPGQTQLIARHIGGIELGLHAHRDYLARRGTPRDAGELVRHALIGHDRPTAFIRQIAKSFPGFDRGAFALRTDSDLAQLALIRCGAGIGACQAALAKRDPALVRVLPKAFAGRLDMWVTMHEDLRGSPRCRAAFDALAEGLDAYVDEQRAPAIARRRRPLPGTRSA
ncbi:LysR family transcriptional regulator [Burkholderia pseudomallei]|uniref:Bacterial regulatory helix-turn-helix, lysR family protein n=1 Tax=Burkholderia pseudomallei TaxID=28450 RepID=A0A2K9D240_BURPE|nr:LysR family transcriptional regulator [Burkholderia pseudomallei]AIP02366.1 bacterial regulatory helix-turn-helix, lysR family protein [Burkholderia pseudomallei]AIP06449.1 bacterial regulatory helix-turn-helix, lysR family protein [Burkholderia pseudomallei]AIV44562.1 bacterial regulatory helix-turn-helix, lysR family protein [Burkholderia pseudomallei TSV 48]AUG25132.1 LysR family transcriptional regulator [Burkholderia pseudomallei]EDU12333.1 transcriptional regulator, LysR family [Burkh